MAHYCFSLFSTCLNITKLSSVWGFTSLDPTTHGEKPALLWKTKNKVLRKALPWTKSFWLQDITIWGMFLAHCLWSTIISSPSWSLKKCPTTPKLGYLRGVGVRQQWCQRICFRSDQSLSRVRLFATPGIAARQASLSVTNSRSSLRLTSIESVMPSSHLILCRPLLLLPPIPPSIRIFSNESTLHMRWPKYWSFSFSIIPSKETPGLIFFRMDWLDLLAVQGYLAKLTQYCKV